MAPVCGNISPVSQQQWSAKHDNTNTDHTLPRLSLVHDARGHSGLGLCVLACFGRCAARLQRQPGLEAEPVGYLRPHVPPAEDVTCVMATPHHAFLGLLYAANSQDHSSCRKRQASSAHHSTHCSYCCAPAARGASISTKRARPDKLCRSLVAGVTVDRIYSRYAVQPTHQLLHCEQKAAPQGWWRSRWQHPSAGYGPRSLSAGCMTSPSLDTCSKAKGVSDPRIFCQSASYHPAVFNDCKAGCSERATRHSRMLSHKQLSPVLQFNMWAHSCNAG